MGHVEGRGSDPIADGEGRVLRVFRFRPARPAFDAIVRDVMVPDLQALDGIEATIVGRRGPGELGERVIATVWSTHAAMEAGVGTSFDQAVFHPEYLDATEEKRLDIAPIAFCLSPGETTDVGVVRVFFGQTRPGQRDAYLAEARSGTQADLDAGRGPLGLYLGTLEGDRFVTVSLWGEWAAVGDATGGTLARPAATRHGELLLDWHVDHYETVSGASTPGVTR